MRNLLVVAVVALIASPAGAVTDYYRLVAPDTFATLEACAKVVASKVKRSGRINRETYDAAYRIECEPIERRFFYKHEAQGLQAETFKEQEEFVRRALQIQNSAFEELRTGPKKKEPPGGPLRLNQGDK
ncbi:hypothetical protein [Bradyrhizobium sp. SZCCHNS3053]|uniref:hypothetical protein n=1 Tax=Bradyrhizobium sp. SZCCHNS3053 TaxID=3057322 RepID=UPI0029167CD2|nr:hypothetical protein [Bradyrhizobium sp. SZCCHNS3053]